MDKKMRVAILLNSRFPTEKAYGIQVLAMARGFASIGVEIAVVYPRRTDAKPEPETGIEFIPFGSLKELRWPWLFSALRILGAAEAEVALKKYQPDIVLVNDPLQAVFLSEKFPVVWDLHDMPNPHSVWRRLLMRLLARRVRGVVSTNQLKLDLLQKIVGTSSQTTALRTIVLPNPVSFAPYIYRSISRDEARTKLGIPREAKMLVYAGQLYDWKGVDTLIAAAEFIPKDVMIHIVGGTGFDLERSKSLAARLSKAAASVVFDGLQPAESIPTWLRAADIAAVPNSGKFEISIRDTNPLKLTEAIAAETPVLASDLPAIREAVESSDAVGVEQAVRFVKPDDAHAWGQAVTELMNDDSARERMRRAAQHVFFLVPEERASRLRQFFVALSQK